MEEGALAGHPRAEAVQAWRQVVSHPVGGRRQKPRDSGLTMVIDKGIGMRQFVDLLETGGEYIDFIKLGFGTSALYEGARVAEKVDLARDFGVEVYPGGTLLEVACFQDRLDAFLARSWAMGFRVLEVSDGTIDLAPEERRRIIRQALDAGFHVLAEVGKKDPVRPMTAEEMVEQIEEDLASGVGHVIIEARDSGVGIGIYDQEGQLKEAMLEAIVQGVSRPERLLWEAPQVRQQRELILRLGPNVNLGNIQVPDVVALESMRVGLRSDTFRTVSRTVAAPRKDGTWRA